MKQILVDIDVPARFFVVATLVLLTIRQVVTIEGASLRTRALITTVSLLAVGAVFVVIVARFLVLAA